MIGSLSSLLIGQLVRISFFSEIAALTFTDIFVLLTVVLFLIYSLFIKKSLTFPRNFIFPASFFVMAAFASTVLAIDYFQPVEMVISASFLLRFIVFLLISVVVFRVIEKQKIYQWLKLILIIGALFATGGFFQFFLLSDLSFLAFYGWDPHQRRVVSSLLDPNFSGIILAIFATLSISIYLYKKQAVFLFLFLLFFLVLLLTFSRSSYLAFLVMMLVIGFLKSPRVFLATVTLFAVAFVLASPVRNRIIGALYLDETSRARLESWQNALTIFRDHPYFGVGFNTYRFAQANYGFFPKDAPLGGHSGSGTDSSILLVLVTTGVLGAFFYWWLLISIFLSLAKNAKRNYLKLAALSSFSGLVVHSQFVNSLFFPQVMLIFWTIFGLTLKDDS